MSGISLTASMRCNLLSLQNIAGQQDIVQNRLATGLKVSSAIDNPSSYYTASSLNNRAADLTALLDAMSQGVQTIKAASEGLQTVSTFLEQAASVAETALSNIDYPDADFFKQLVGNNGAVVTTTEELFAAINAGKETVVVYGTININDTDGDIILKENQKLVGVGYFGNFDSDIDKFSQLIITTSKAQGEGILLNGNNSLVSDLTIDFSSFYNGEQAIVKDVINTGSHLQNNTVKNLDIKLSISRRDGRNSASAIAARSGSILNVAGNINIEVNNNAWGIFAETTSTININANLNGNANINTHNSSVINISSASKIRASSLSAFLSAVINIEAGTELFFEKDDAVSVVRAKNNITIDNKRYNFDNILTADFIALASTNSDDFFAGAFAEKSFSKSNYRSDIGGKYITSYLGILEQMDQIALDSAYKGVNLLQGQTLKINFNEDRSSQITVSGVEISSTALELQTTEWQNSQNIAASLAEIAAALNQIRSFASEFGNYYSIVTTRQDFTENLINVLEEGSDKLTLADMNQESANMLALQTSQQLAVNSLSLASQASQAVLRLF